MIKEEFLATKDINGLLTTNCKISQIKIKIYHKCKEFCENIYFSAKKL